MGSQTRLQRLRPLFEDLKRNGVILIVVSLNFRNAIEKILFKHGLLFFSSRIYDRNDVWRKDVLTKQVFIKLFIDKYKVHLSRCVLVDDQRSNIENAPCRVIKIKYAGGIRKENDFQIRDILCPKSCL